jgi:hypothetical protein
MHWKQPLTTFICGGSQSITPPTNVLTANETQFVNCSTWINNSFVIEQEFAIPHVQTSLNYDIVQTENIQPP